MAKNKLNYKLFFIAVLFIAQFFVVGKVLASTQTIYAKSSSWFSSSFWYQSPPQPSWFVAIRPNTYRGEITFTTGTIPSNAQVNSVVLHFFPKACAAGVPTFVFKVAQLTTDPTTLNKSTDAATIYANAAGGNVYTSSAYGLSTLCTANANQTISLGATAASDFQNRLSSHTNWFGLGFLSDTGADSATGQIWGYDNASYKPYIVVDYIVNSGPVASYVSQPVQTSANMVSTNVSVYDADSNVTSLAVQFSTNTTNWYNATLGTVTASAGTVATSSGSITSIDTDTGTTTLSIQWNFANDIANTTKTGVYLKVTPNDGTVDGTAQTSNIFYFISRQAKIITTNRATINKTLTNFLTSSLAGWWTFDGNEINTTTSTDKSGNSNNATLVNNPTKTIGKLGQGLNFNGSNNYLSAVHSNSLNTTSSISMSAWIRPTSVSGTSTLAIKGDPFSGYWFYLLNGKPNLFLSKVGNTWLAKDTGRQWRGIALSADGTKQTAVASGGQIYLSTNSGNTWTATSTARTWEAVTMSADGTKQTAVANCGTLIYVSTDSGNTWTGKGTSACYVDIAMSTSGLKQTAVVDGGTIYTSGDTGNSWTARDSNRAWQQVSVSADGTKQTAIVYNGQIYISTDSGLNWTAKDSNRAWVDIAMSADGTKQIALNYNGFIYRSTDSGLNWVAVLSDASREWRRVSMSADGNIIVADAGNDAGDYIYISYDGGTTWSAKDSARNSRVGVAISSDGKRMSSLINNGYIYVSEDRTLTSLTTLSINNWYHLAYTFNSTTASIYINGVLNTSTNYGTIAIDSNTSTLGIGGSSVGNYFSGKLDDVRIYNTGLTAAQVKKLYNGGKGTTVRF